MKLDSLFKGDGNFLKSLSSIAGMINNFSGNTKSNNSSRSSSSNSNTRLCNSKVISMEDARIKILSGDTLVLDVRSQNEFNIMKIKGAINIPIDKLEINMVRIEPNKEKEILVYCATGIRTKLAVQVLYKLGYKYVLVWEGGGINSFKYLDVIENNNNMDMPGIM